MSTPASVEVLSSTNACHEADLVIQFEERGGVFRFTIRDTAENKLTPEGEIIAVSNTATSLANWAFHWGASTVRHAYLI